jgi:hypothetical protein
MFQVYWTGVSSGIISANIGLAINHFLPSPSNTPKRKMPKLKFKLPRARVDVFEIGPGQYYYVHEIMRAWLE